MQVADLIPFPQQPPILKKFPRTRYPGIIRRPRKERKHCLQLLLFISCLPSSGDFEAELVTTKGKLANPFLPAKQVPLSQYKKLITLLTIF